MVWPERGDNLVVHWENGDPGPVEALLRKAAKRVTVDIVNNRLVPSPMEPRAALASYDPDTDTITLYCPSQGGRRIQTTIAKDILNIAPDRLRVISPDTGGGFGIAEQRCTPSSPLSRTRRGASSAPSNGVRTGSRPSSPTITAATRSTMPRWVSTRSGRVVALKVETIVNVGAYLAENGPRIPINGGGRIIPCAYDIEAFHFSVKPVFTNTTPTDTYRGAGRPEANFLMERLMDAAADACGLTRDEIRRRNLIPSRLPVHDPDGPRNRLRRLRRNHGHGARGGGLGRLFARRS